MVFYMLDFLIKELTEYLNQILFNYLIFKNNDESPSITMANLISKDK
jgi:hypothetical protein